MPYKLISLVFLLFFIIINKVHSENKFILPLKKPSIFKNFKEDAAKSVGSNLPQKKPTIQSSKPKKVEPRKEPIKTEPKKEIENNEIKQIVNIFIFPKKKPVTYNGTAHLKVLIKLKIEILEL